MEELKAIYNFGYSTDEDYNRKESVVNKDNFLRKIVWKFIKDVTVSAKNDNGDKGEIELSKLYPFVCYDILNGKIITIKHIMMRRDEFYNPYPCRKLVEQYINKYGFINCIPIGTIEREVLYSNFPIYDDIKVTEVKRCVDITNCNKNILDNCEYDNYRNMLF